MDGQKFEDIETAGRQAFLSALREDLVTGRYRPMPNRPAEIPKGKGKVRTLQIPCIRDRVGSSLIWTPVKTNPSAERSASVADLSDAEETRPYRC
jgi:hypothetical protein